MSKRSFAISIRNMPKARNIRSIPADLEGSSSSSKCSARKTTGWKSLKKEI